MRKSTVTSITQKHTSSRIEIRPCTYLMALTRRYIHSNEFTGNVDFLDNLPMLKNLYVHVIHAIHFYASVILRLFLINKGIATHFNQK